MMLSVCVLAALFGAFALTCDAPLRDAALRGLLRPANPLDAEPDRGVLPQTSDETTSHAPASSPILEPYGDEERETDDNATQTTTTKPNIVFVMVDDLGWGNVGFTEHLFDDLIPHSFKKSFTNADYLIRAKEIAKSSPTITKLAAEEGRVLLRHYTHCTCSPSRSSLQSGRLPVHVQMALLNPCHPTSGIPAQMTGIAEKMKLANYSTHFVGKWDAGMTTPRHIPKGRGYDTSLNYFSHGNWMWTEDVWVGSLMNATRTPQCVLSKGCARDLWNTDHPAKYLNGTLYEEELFILRMERIISSTPRHTPLFLMYNSRVAHYPLQAPSDTQLEFGFVGQPNRRVYLSMVSYLDGNVKRLVRALQKSGRWDNTLFVFTSDNGGVVKTTGRCVTATHGLACFNGEAGANNFPLRGGKYTNWEGGIRVASFVAGGVVPRYLRGVPVPGPMHIADWYATFCAMAGVDPTDAVAARASLPPIDSVDASRLLLGGPSERTKRESILLSPRGIIVGDMKLLVGVQFGADWGGVLYPNLSTSLPRRDEEEEMMMTTMGEEDEEEEEEPSFFASPSPTSSPHRRRGRHRGGDVYSTQLMCYPGCVFNVTADPLETRNLYDAEDAEAMALYNSLAARLAKESKSIWYRPGSRADPACLETARTKWGGFLGPWRDVPSNE